MRKKGDYFRRVFHRTSTEFWINNAKPKEAENAIANGAVGATTNPTYPSKLFSDPPYINKLIDQALEESDSHDQIADIVYKKAVARLQDLFQPFYEKSNGRYGYVAIQGDPRVNENPDAIIAGAHDYRKMGENIIIKVPATPAGAMAMEELTATGCPTIATLGFSVDQAVYMAEAYQRGLRRAKTKPLCYITLIAGILDEYLKNEAERQGVAIKVEWIKKAGCEASRTAYRVFKERNYEALLLGGGARGPHHFSELVGGAMAITIGWGLAEQLIETDAPVVSRIDTRTSDNVLSELEVKLPDFHKANHEGSLEPEEFQKFGPVASFQESFLAGIDILLNAISKRKTERGLS